MLVRAGLLALLACLLALGCSRNEAPAAERLGSPPAPATSLAGGPTSPSASPSAAATPVRPNDAVVASTAAIATADLPRVRFTGTGGAEATLPIEVPPREEYTIGLSGRWSLEDRGMLFYYPGGDYLGSFWMKDTHIDLDIAFVDRDLRVIEVRRMTAESLDTHQPARAYLAAIEAPAGWYAERGIEAGARVEFLFDVEATLAGR